MDSTPDRTSLYRLYDEAGGLLYVGITKSVQRRWTEHETTKSWWPEVTAATLEHYPTREAALEAERAAIIAERPRHNVTHARHIWVGADQMPDDCPECGGSYLPYQWRAGRAEYLCGQGHTWVRQWGHAASGSAARNAGLRVA